MSSPSGDATATSAPADAARPGEHVQALLMLLPAAVLAWPGPGSFLRDDFDAAETGAAVALLATLPALACLALRRHASAARGWFALLPLLLAGPWPALDDGDGFARQRAIDLVVVATALFVAGASLGAAGRRTFARGLVVLAIAYTLVAHGDAERAFTGALGNTGSVSQAALAGAVAAGVWLAAGWNRWSFVCALAFALYAAFVARVPVFAGALAGAAGLGACALAARACTRRARTLSLALAGVLVLAVLAWPRANASDSPRDAQVSSAPAADSGAPARAGDTGGFSVRVLVWRSTLALAAARPWTGAGPGQFAREFPPFRAPAEIELSTHQRRLAQETEVEHAHCDYLTILAEGGLVWAASALVLLGAIAFAAWRTLRASASTTADVALAAAALALLANAAVHGVLFHDAVSSSLAFGAFGALAGPIQGPPRLVRKLVPLALLVLALLASAAALATLRHARALAPIHRGRELSSAATERALADALAAVPDSPPALSLRARLLETRQAEPALLVRAWSDVCSVRPHRVEANVQLGLAQLRAGDAAAADASWSRAQALDPGHPGVLWNRMTLALEQDRVADASTLCDALERAQRLDRERLGALAARLEVEGHADSAQFAWTRALPEIAGAGADRTFQLARDRRESGDVLAAAALELRAQRSWGREHAAAQRWNDAVRTFRQVLRAAATGGRTPSPRFVFEYAAALSFSGRDDEAAREVAGLVLDAAGRAQLPEWARARAVERGWVAP